jgi:ribonuclease-3 family protein
MAQKVGSRMDHPLLYIPPSKEARLLNPLVLAYVGDAVYDTFIRQYLVAGANHRPNHLHRQATRYVSAKAQARALELWLPILTEEETDIVKRGRNAKSGTSPKNTGILEYRHSTAFECLIGFLYYERRFERLNTLMYIAADSVTVNPENEQT